MRTYRIFPIILIALSTLFAISCSKSAGPRGPAGATGPVGAAGANGSIIYSGSGAPAASLGNTGDFYLDLSTSLLYGPKTSSGWGTGISLKGNTGAAGATGAAGSQIYSGTTVPATTLGNIGDYYLNTTTYLLYGPKKANGWGSPIALQGPQGPQGPQGNADVQVEVFSVPGNQWVFNTANLNSNYALQFGNGNRTTYFMQYYTYPFSKVTQSVLNTGMVLVYFTPTPVDNPDLWVPLPYQFASFLSQYNTNFVAVPAVGQVTVGFFFSKIDPSITPPDITTYQTTFTYRFKVVAISGTLSTQIRQGQVDVHNYNEISRFTGLWQQEKTAAGFLQ